MKNFGKVLPPLHSVNRSSFAELPSIRLSQSRFDRSHDHITAFNNGELIPILWDEVIPGDVVDMSVGALCRLSTPIVPFLTQMDLDIQAFFVPNRLVWEHWEQFIGNELDEETKQPVYTAPMITSPVGGFLTGTLADYLGVPVGVAGLDVSVLPFRAYDLIWNEWYRSEFLQEEIDVNLGDDTTSDVARYATLNPLRRNQRHNYFRSGLPNTQLGPSVEIPIGGFAPVVGNGISLGLTDGDANGALGGVGSYSLGAYSGSFGSNVGSAPSGALSSLLTFGVTGDAEKSGLVADLSSATAIDINELRFAIQLQRLHERDCRGGVRYVELLLSHFGCTSPDARLQRPEYLGRVTLELNTSPVAQTSSTDSETPQGNLSAVSFFRGGKALMRHSFVEHGILMLVASTRSQQLYQQGLERKFSRVTRNEYYWPEFANLGEQPIYNREIYAQGTSADSEPFAYQERYAEFRYAQNRVSGKMRSTETGGTPLDYWHLGFKYDSLPTLASTFIAENAPVERVVAVTDEPQFIADFYFRAYWSRSMPVYSVPGLMDHH